MDIGKFVYKGIEFALDVDDMIVDARITAAIERFQAQCKRLDERLEAKEINSLALGYVDIARTALNEIFDRDDAAALLMKDVTRLSRFQEELYRITAIIGEMRTAAFVNIGPADDVKVRELSEKKKK